MPRWCVSSLSVFAIAILYNDICFTRTQKKGNWIPKYDVEGLVIKQEKNNGNINKKRKIHQCENKHDLEISYESSNCHLCWTPNTAIHMYNCRNCKQKTCHACAICIQIVDNVYNTGGFESKEDFDMDKQDYEEIDLIKRVMYIYTRCV